MSAVQTATGIAPILYTNGSIASYLNSSLNTYKLWIADPDGSSTAQPTNIGVWTTWAFKQYSWTGTVSGISSQVDLNVFNGNTAAFNALINCNATGIIGQQMLTQFRLYPNPASTKIIIENSSTEGISNGQVIIYSMQGQVILQQSLQEGKMEMDISSFTAGMYFVSIQMEGRVELKKFIKE